METRDQWYKPNLLYNIHYRPPKKPEPPKMIVKTVQFNPSVCTCGEHGCQPQYRMEKRVLWTNKEVCIGKQQSKVNENIKKDERREIKCNERITEHERKNESKVIESKQMRLKEEIGQERRFKESDANNQTGLKSEIGQEFRFIKGDGNKCGAAENFKDREASEGGVRKSYHANDLVEEIENTEVKSDNDGSADEKEEGMKKKEYDQKDEVGCNDRKAYICIGEEATNTDSIRENNISGRGDRDNFEGRINEGVNSEKRICNNCESALNDCNDDGRSSEEGQIDNDHMAGDDAGAIDKDDTCNEEEHCSINRILQNSSADTGDTCRPENEDYGFEDMGIASAFGIMSVYCNSELHSWRSFESQDG